MPETTTTPTPTPPASPEPEAQPVLRAAQEAAKAATAPTQELDWRVALPEDLRTHPALKSFKDVGGLAKSYVEAQRMLGRTIPLPRTPEERATALERLGAPKDPEAYAVQDEGLKRLAADLRLLPEQAQAVERWIGQRLASLETATERAVAEAEQQLRAAWGDAYSSNLQLASRAARRLGGQELLDALERTGAGADPVVIQALHKVGLLLAEDGLIPTGSPTLAQLETQIATAMSDPAYLDRTHPRHEQQVEEVQRLFQQVAFATGR